MADAEVLITGDSLKLPPDVAALLDPATPLPAGTAFFETRYDFAHMTRRLIFACVLGFLTTIVVPFGIYEIFHPGPVTVYSRVDYLPLGFGLVCALATWMAVASLRTCWKLRGAQARGESTRRGTFVTPLALVQASEMDTTVIPPNRFLGLDGRTVKYEHNKLPKSYRLPAALMNKTNEELQAAIIAWASRHGKEPSMRT